jgi:hypothetical protein
VHSGRVDRDGIGESDYSFGPDERDRLHLLGDCHKYLWDKRCIVVIELVDASGAGVELHLIGAGGRRAEHGVLQLHGDAQRRL